MEGRKFDDGKLRLELIPPELEEAVGTILTFGASKYGDRNWEKGMKWSRVFGALKRHLLAWQKGEAKDPETGKSHLWHVGCCVAFLIAYEARGVGENDIRQDDIRHGVWRSKFPSCTRSRGFPVQGTFEDLVTARMHQCLDRTDAEALVRVNYDQLA